MTSVPSSALDEAVRLHRSGALMEAMTRYRQILQREAGNADAHYYLAVAAHQQGDNKQAFESVRNALAIDARHARAHRLMGMLLSRQGDLDKALASYDRAIEHQPDQAEAHGARGDVLIDLGRFAEAVQSYDRAVALRPDSAGDWCNRGAALLGLDRTEEAVASYTQAIALQPDFSEAYSSRGNALAKLGRYQDALADYDRSLALRPRNADVLNNRGNALLQLGRLEESAASLNAALAIDDGHLAALLTYGTVLHKLGRAEEALACCTRAMAIDPGNPETSFNLGIMCLGLGRLAEGWEHYESRLQVKGTGRRTYPQPQWDGSPIDGVLLVWGEQGLGDQILYAGMMSELVGSAGRIVLEVEPRLVPLFARSFPDIEVVAEHPERLAYNGPPVEAQISIGSLGRFFRKSFDAFPRREQGYLIPDAERSRRLRERLAGDGRKVIGLSWISRAESGQAKSAQLTDLDSVLRLPGCRFVDLQYGDTRLERDEVERVKGYRIERLPDIDTTADIDGLAALIGACDAVVTVSNTTAHLAGALGVPTWVAVPHGQARIWYWFRDGDLSPWYPRVRVLRQGAGQPWPDLFEVAAKEFRGLLK
jgi:tetratricopeptide (TPR) repeat protein